MINCKHVLFIRSVFKITCVFSRCENEYVELRDGGTEISPFIGRYCQDMPNPKVTTGNLLRVKYFTNSDEQRNGFKANVSIAECGGTLTKSGHILSREHQLKIGSECVWWIKASYKNAINVNVVSLNVGKARRNCTAGSENGYLLLYEVGDEESVMNGKILCLKHYFYVVAIYLFSLSFPLFSYFFEPLTEFY